MRFMVITKATAASEAGTPPPSEVFDAMGGFIQELMDAGVLLAAEGLSPSSAGVRLHVEGDTTTVVDGPFAETKELIAGFFLVETASLEECVQWFRRYPRQALGEEPTNIEIRRVIQGEDFTHAMTDEQAAAVAERDRSTRFG